MEDCGCPISYRRPKRRSGWVIPLAKPWSPWQATILCFLLALFFTAVSAYVSIVIAPLYRSIQFDLPEITVETLWACDLLWNRFGWTVLIALSVALPIYVIPRVPAPCHQEDRQAAAKFGRMALQGIYLCVTGFVVIALVAAFV
jgi:hypothetical protein